MISASQKHQMIGGNNMKEKIATIIGTGVGGLAGSAIGSHAGIAIFGTAVSGAAPFAVAGAVTLVLAAKRIGLELDK